MTTDKVWPHVSIQGSCFIMKKYGLQCPICNVIVIVDVSNKRLEEPKSLLQTIENAHYFVHNHMPPTADVMVKHKHFTLEVLKWFKENLPASMNG